MSFFLFRTRRISAFKNDVSEHFSKHKALYWLFLSFLLAGFIVGIIAGVNKSGNSCVEYFPDIVILNFLSSKISVGQLFLLRFFSLFGMVLLIWVLSFNKWTSLLSVLIVLFNSFVLGATCAVLISSFKLVGFLNVIFAYLPCHLVSLLCLIMFSVVSIKYCFESSKFGGCVFYRDYFDCVKGCLILTVLFHFIACILEIIIFPWLSSVIVIN